MERAILRQALLQAVNVGSYASLATALGFSAIDHPINYLSDSTSEVFKRIGSGLEVLSRVGGHEADHGRAGLWVAAQPLWGDRSVDRDRVRRKIAKALVEFAPGGDRNVLLVLIDKDVDEIELVLPRRRSNGSLGTVRALINRSDPTRYHLELLESLVLNPADSTPIITRRWSDAFNVEKVTKSFYLEFRALRDRLVEMFGTENPKNSLLKVGSNETAQSELHRYVTRNLGRMLFLWFIQCKGWLNGDTHYLQNLFLTRCRTGGNHNFFSETLIPLFFEAIARKPQDRTEAARSLGSLPYLNGGLFNQSLFEDRLYGEEREHVDVVLSNDAFDPRAHSPEMPTVLGLLASYRFTTRESTPDDQSLDPDPELLGKVFENLNEDRKKTGTYYTPREVVRFMCRKALDGYLRNTAGVNDETLQGLRLEAVDPSATETRLSREERMGLTKALLEVKVCDPAVGSGAFPVGMLQEIVQLLIGIEQSADVSVSIGGQMVAEWKEKIITNCLYGVDINPEAVEICHLRLWLSMVIDADRPVPLPNLDFRFEAGDSLVDRIAEFPLRNSLPAADQTDLALGEIAQGLHETERLREKYALADDPAEARRLRAEIKEAQLDLVRSQIDEAITQCKVAAKDHHATMGKLRRLGEDGSISRKTQKKAEDLSKTIEILKTFRTHLSPDAPYKKPFLWPLDFPEVFDKGGFDIVIANPPYVRQEKLAPEDQQAYAASFPEVHRGTADLLVYFYGRATHILREGGRLAFITSNKFHRAGYGDGLRGYLSKSLTIEYVIDFGDLAVFDAIAYPSILVGAEATPETDAKTVVARLTHIVRRELAEAGLAENVATVRERLEDMDGLIDRNNIVDFPQVLLRTEGWVLEEPALVRLFDRLTGLGTPLGEFVQERMYYGIKTGLNEAFVIDEAKRADLIAADAKSADLIKPWLRGKDIKRWRSEWDGLYAIAIPNSGDAANENPWRASKNERDARTVFRRAYPALHDHLCRFEEDLRSRADQGRWWWELRACTYYAEFMQPKVVWATLAPEPRFLWDNDGYFTNQKCYIVTGLPKWVVGIMNSSMMFALAAGTRLAEKQGGFYEWEKKYMVGLPIITPDASVQKALSLLVDRSALKPGAHDAEVSDLVETLYEVTPKERKLLREWVEVRKVAAKAEEPDDE
jgi:hypothetical protein